jgi:hypothetical protein
MTEVEKLAKAIRDLHGVEATHVRSEPIRETFCGETVWDGIVGVFSIRGHPDTTIAYAWSHEADDGGRRYVAVLGVPPVNSAVDAVRAAVVAEIKRRQ